MTDCIVKIRNINFDIIILFQNFTFGIKTSNTLMTMLTLNSSTPTGCDFLWSTSKIAAFFTTPKVKALTNVKIFGKVVNL